MATEHWWEKIKRNRERTDVLLTSHFFEKWIGKDIFAAREEAILDAIKAIKHTGDFLPAVEENEPDKWYCIFKNKKGGLLEMPVLHRPHLNKSGEFISIVKSIYRINNYEKERREKALNSYTSKHKTNGQ